MKSKLTICMRVLRFFGMLLLFLVVGLVGYELFGMAVNHSAGAIQTKKLCETLEESFADTAILDIHEKTGHVSGNGNHVDMLTVIVFRTEKPYEDVLASLSPWNTSDGWGFDLQQLNVLEQSIKETGSAPFVDNIEGH